MPLLSISFVSTKIYGSVSAVNWFCWQYAHEMTIRITETCKIKLQCILKLLVLKSWGFLYYDMLMLTSL
jgi:hypothetical protein